MENQRVGEFVSKRFTWTIENFSKLKTQKHYSEVFLVGDWKWRILVFPKGNNVNHLSVYLDAVEASDLPFLWTRYAQFCLKVVNQLNSDMSIWNETQHDFHSTQSDWGFTSFMPLTELCDSSKGFLWNDRCILEAEVKVRKASIKSSQETGSSALTKPLEQEDEEKEPSIVDSVQVPPSSEQVLALQDSPSSERVQSNVESVQVPRFSRPPMVPSSEQVGIEPTDIPAGKLVDFRGLVKIEKAFVPLLEEVCSWHPALIECQKKRSRMFFEWAFTALGRVLHFLKTRKVKDMTEDACQQLQLLWDELETFNFDLAWLEPHVKSALDVKKIVERAGQVKELMEDVNALEIDVKRLRGRVAVAEVDLEVAKRDSAKAEGGFGGFGGIDMDEELGFGKD